MEVIFAVPDASKGSLLQVPPRNTPTLPVISKVLEVAHVSAAPLPPVLVEEQLALPIL